MRTILEVRSLISHDVSGSVIVPDVTRGQQRFGREGQGSRLLNLVRRHSAPSTLALATSRVASIEDTTTDAQVTTLYAFGAFHRPRYVDAMANIKRAKYKAA